MGRSVTSTGVTTGGIGITGGITKTDTTAKAFLADLSRLARK